MRLKDLRHGVRHRRGKSKVAPQSLPTRATYPERPARYWSLLLPPSYTNTRR